MAERDGRSYPYAIPRGDVPGHGQQGDRRHRGTDYGNLTTAGPLLSSSSKRGVEVDDKRRLRVEDSGCWSHGCSQGYQGQAEEGYPLFVSSWRPSRSRLCEISSAEPRLLAMSVSPLAAKAFWYFNCPFHFVFEEPTFPREFHHRR